MKAITVARGTKCMIRNFFLEKLLLYFSLVSDKKEDPYDELPAVSRLRHHWFC